MTENEWTAFVQGLLSERLANDTLDISLICTDH